MEKQTTTPFDVVLYLKGIKFPVRKAGILSVAQGNNATSEVMGVLGALPDQEYFSVVDIIPEFGESDVELSSED